MTPLPECPPPATLPSTCMMGSLSTGVRSIDIQHQELLQHIEAFESAHALGDGLEAIQVLLPQLEAYVLFHFDEEEHLMDSLANEAVFIQMHKSQHMGFITRLQDIKRQFSQHGDVDLADQLVVFLREWLLHHIATTDVTLGAKLLAQSSRRHKG